MHECPACGQWCHCNGDIDDIQVSLDAPENCRHCQCPECGEIRDYCDCGFWDDGDE